MGVYIKGLKLPSAERQGELLILTDDGRCVDMFSREYEAVELQPHGRLIDADALLESIKEARKKDPEIEDVYIDDYFTVAEWVVSAPTIIEREGE